MLACIAPTELCFSESMSTVKYASRAVQMRNLPVVSQTAETATLKAMSAKVEVLAGRLKAAEAFIASKLGYFDPAEVYGVWSLVERFDIEPFPDFSAK